MQLSILPIPSKNIRFALQDRQWQACLDAWITITGLALGLSDDDFASSVGPSAADFLTSYMHERVSESTDELTDSSRRLAVVQPLAKNVFLVTIRLLTGVKVPHSLASLSFLCDFAMVFGKRNASATRRAIDAILESHEDSIEDETDQSRLDKSTEAFLPLLKVSSFGSFLIRTKFARALVEQYLQNNSQKKFIWRIAFMLATNDAANLKFLDALLMSDGHSNKLALDLMSSPEFVSRLQQCTQDRPQFLNLVEQLMTESQSNRHKGAHYNDLSSAVENEAGGDFDRSQDETAELLSKISQVQDLFPDLGEGFIEACLQVYDQDIEAVTMHLLEDDLPPHLNELDRSQRSLTGADTKQPARRDVPDIPQLPPTQRANIYDNDEFDRLEFDRSRVTQGRRLSSSAVSMLRRTLSADQKMKVLSLAYDPDDDELDDTYDQFEGAGAVDLQTNDELDDSSKPDVPSIDDILFLIFETEPEVFERTARKAASRQDLRARTNLSDEQIEGWKAMLDREPSRIRRLQEKNAFSGAQNDLHSSKWSGSETGPTNSDRGRGGRIRGSRAPGRADRPKSEKSSEQIKRDRARKDARGAGRGRGHGGGMRGQARPQG